MAKIDRDTIDRLAHLARLEFDEAAKAEIEGDLKRIIGFVEKLNELNVGDTEPLIYMVDEENVMREDEVKQEISQKEALSNAPKKDSDYFKVPRVVERS